MKLAVEAEGEATVPRVPRVEPVGAGAQALMVLREEMDQERVFPVSVPSV
jgi:hypothetical protein